MRGVNKLIVEIKDTENEYFDRAILFLKPDKITTDQSELNINAEKLLYEVRNGKQKKHLRKKIIITACTAAVFISAALLLFFLL